jgi:DNA-binding CsgD family transcriptional regulator
VGSRTIEIALPTVDLWAPVPFDALPASLIENAAKADWTAVRADLKVLMDAVTTDGPYGRALLQFVMKIPLPIDPVLERYRASICVDHGDWDGLLRHLSGTPIEAAEPIGVRDAILAPLDRQEIPRHVGAHQKVLFEAYEFQFQRAVGRWRHWAQRLFGFHADVIWTRPDIPAGRHLRFRRLHDALALAYGEALGGRLPVAHALAREAQSLGDPGEPGKESAADLEYLLAVAMGSTTETRLRVPPRIASPTGPSPLGSWELIFHAIPFYALRRDGTLGWASELGQRTAVGLGSLRAQLQAQTWRVADWMLEGRTADDAGLPGLLAESQRAAPGLRVVPALLRAVASRRIDDFRTAEALARQVGNVWAQVSALTWLVALDPQPVTVRWLHRLLETTGWRRPILVPPTVAADAALGLAAAGKRGVSIVEVAALGERANVTVEVAMRHIDDAEAPREARLAAVEALGKLGTTHSREILHRVSRRTDDIGAAARRIVTSRTAGTTLSEREFEVLDLARHGLTNRDIGERLSLSPHTIARHVANARAKLGAANRAEAAAKFEEMKV